MNSKYLVPRIQISLVGTGTALRGLMGHVQAGGWDKGRLLDQGYARCVLY